MFESSIFKVLPLVVAKIYNPTYYSRPTAMSHITNFHFFDEYKLVV